VVIEHSSVQVVRAEQIVIRGAKQTLMFVWRWLVKV